MSSSNYYSWNNHRDERSSDGRHSKKGNDQAQALVGNQVLIHEAQMIDTQRRVISAINGLQKALEKRDKNLIENEENNLNIQITCATAIFNDKKYKGKCQGRLNSLKKEFSEELKKLPESFQQYMKQYLDIYNGSFDNFVENNIEIKGYHGEEMNEEQITVCLGGFNYANLMNDELRKKSLTAKSVEDLTVFKRVEVSSMDNDTYMNDYEMKEQYAKVFRGYATKTKETIMKYTNESNPKVFFKIMVDSKAIGVVVFELMANAFPILAENFRRLCTGENGKGSYGKPLHYKGSTFHRIYPDFICQGGDFIKGNGTSGESSFKGSFMKEEAKVTHTEPYLLSMQLNKKGACDSKFIITSIANTNLDKSYIAFGKVVKGTEVIDNISKLGSTDGFSKKVVKIIDCGELTSISKPPVSAAPASNSSSLMPKTKETDIIQISFKMRIDYKTLCEITVELLGNIDQKIIDFIRSLCHEGRFKDSKTSVIEDGFMYLKKKIKPENISVIRSIVKKNIDKRNFITIGTLWLYDEDGGLAIYIATTNFQGPPESMLIGNVKKGKEMFSNIPDRKTVALQIQDCTECIVNRSTLEPMAKNIPIQNFEESKTEKKNPIVMDMSNIEPDENNPIIFIEIEIKPTITGKLVIELYKNSYPEVVKYFRDAFTKDKTNTIESRQHSILDKCIYITVPSIQKSQSINKDFSTFAKSIPHTEPGFVILYESKKNIYTYISATEYNECIKGIIIGKVIQGTGILKDVSKIMNREKIYPKISNCGECTVSNTQKLPANAIDQPITNNNPPNYSKGQFSYLCHQDFSILYYYSTKEFYKA